MFPLFRLYYFLSLGALGAVMPYVAARLEAAGVDGVTLGALMAMVPGGRLLTAPIWAWAADRWALGGVLLRIGCAVATAGVALLLFAHGPVAAAAGLFLFAAGRAPAGPIVDAMILDRLDDRGDYGRVRLWGSVGFLAVALACGELSDLGLDPMGPGLFLSAATMACAFAFPKRGEGGPAPVLPALRELLREPFLVPFLATGFLQALTLSVYDAFFSAHVRALGLPDLVTGAAVAVGVASEVTLMRLGRPILARFGGPRVLLVAAVAGVPRWILTATLTDPVALVAAQVLHGVAFGAFWIAGVQMMSERAPTRIAASAQSLFSAASYGFGAFVGALVAGWVRARWGTGAIFEALAGVSTVSVLTAAIVVVRWREVVTNRDRSEARVVS